MQTTTLQTEAKTLIDLVYKDIYEKKVVSMIYTSPITDLCLLVKSEFPKLEVVTNAKIINVSLDIYNKSLEVLEVYQRLYYDNRLVIFVTKKNNGQLIDEDLKSEFPHLHIERLNRHNEGFKYVSVSFKDKDSLRHIPKEDFPSTPLQQTKDTIKSKAMDFIKRIYRSIFRCTSMAYIIHESNVMEFVSLLKAEFPHLDFDTDSHPGVIVSIRQLKTPEVLSVYEKLFRDGKVTFDVSSDKSGEKGIEIYKYLRREFPCLNIYRDATKPVIMVQFNETSQFTESPITPLETVICPYQAHKDKMAKNQLLELEKLIDLNGEKCIYETTFKFLSSNISPENTEKMGKHGYKITKSPIGLTMTWEWVPNSVHSDKLEKFQLEELKKLVGVGSENYIHEVPSLIFRSVFHNITDNNIKEMEKYGYEWIYSTGSASPSGLVWIK